LTPSIQTAAPGAHRCAPGAAVVGNGCTDEPRARAVRPAPTTRARNAGAGAEVARELEAFVPGEGVLPPPPGSTAYRMPPSCVTPGQVDNVYDVIGRFLEAR